MGGQKAEGRKEKWEDGEGNMRTKGEVGQRSTQENNGSGWQTECETGRQRERVGQESSGKEMDRGGDMMTDGEMGRQEQT